MFAVFRWIVKVSVAVIKWAYIHPFTALVAGVAARLVGQRLMEQHWWGARIVGGYLSGLGFLLGTTAVVGVAARVAFVRPGPGARVTWMSEALDWLSPFSHMHGFGRYFK